MREIDDRPGTQGGRREDGRAALGKNGRAGMRRETAIRTMAVMFARVGAARSNRVSRRLRRMAIAGHDAGRGGKARAQVMRRLRGAGSYEPEKQRADGRDGESRAKLKTYGAHL